MIVSLLLIVHASWTNRPMFVVWMLPSVMKPCFGSTPLLRTCVVAVGAARRRTPMTSGVFQRDRHEVARLAAEHVVADAVGLHAELELVLAASAARRRCVSLEVGARLLVARRPWCCVGMLVKPVPCCRLAGTSRKPTLFVVVQTIARLLGHVRVVLSRTM